MPIEIERKFLLKKKPTIDKVLLVYKIKQGYLYTNGGGTLRVRIEQRVDKVTLKPIGEKTAYLGLKLPIEGMKFARSEQEPEIPLKMAKALLKKCGDYTVHKHRFEVMYGTDKDFKIWEVDVMRKKLAGMEIVEIELDSEDQKFIKPDWVGKEVTFDKRYKNKNLAITQTIPKNYKGPK
jgi:adenylate cyclase